MNSIALISDIHGNLPALEAVLADIGSREVGAVYCLGDLVGYGPEPNGVVDLIRAADIPTIMGNYDEGVGFDLGHCGCFYPDAEAKRIGAASYEFTSRVVTADSKTYLRALPRELYLELEGRKVHMVHGSPRRINEYLLPTREVRTFERIAAAESSDVLVFGHTHTAWYRVFGGVLFINVASVGRPKDGDPRASYTLVRLGLHGEGGDAGGERGEDGGAGSAVEDAFAVQEVRVAYDVERAANGVLSAGLPTELAQMLRHGG